MDADDSLDAFLRVYADTCRRHGVKPLPITSREMLTAILLAAVECYGSEVDVVSEAARWLQ
jgi:hypothetical protein